MYKESPGAKAFKEIGNGVLDWPKILRAAEAARVEHYFVEQDQTPGNPVDSLRLSMEYLKKLEY
jgi:sugar phosphate isomerase/epimerase